MIINKLIGSSQKPEIYTKGTDVMWTDPHISKFLLETHLNENIDLASRKGTTIDLTVEWILDKTPSGKLNMLDLGCGPGLYTEKFAQKGHTVKGIDFSKNSIEYAKNSAFKKNLEINYEHKNYLLLDEIQEYDLIIMIFTDFGVLNPEERVTLLTKIKRALKPSGIFIFDVLSDNFLKGFEETKSWDLEDVGFWKDSPYLALNNSYLYENEKVSLNQHILIDGNNNIDIYRFWIHYFGNNDLNKLLSDNGFCNVRCFDSVLPDNEFLTKKDTTFCICEKE